MQLSEKERAYNREAFRAMSLAQKADYIFAYYKLPLVLALIVVVALGSVLKYQLTHKEALLYVGLANVEATEEVQAQLNEGFVAAQGESTRTHEVYLYQNLYLVDPEESVDHQYSYASRLKLLATTDAEELDVVIMSQQAYDLLSHSGYLFDLSDVAGQIPTSCQDLLVDNEVIVEDNELEVQLGEAEVYEAKTTTVTNAIDASGFGIFSGLSDGVYLGLIGNTTRTDMALAYLDYLAGC